MKLKQDPSHKNFYLPENGNRFFIFSGDTSRAEFNMNEAFSIYGFNFLIVFYQDPELVITENLETVLANKVVNVRAIYWIDRIGTADINSCPNIPFFSRNQVDEYEITFGRDQNVVTARNSTDTVTNSATVLFNEDTSSIDFFVNEGKKDKLITKSNLGEAVQEYHAFTIPLKHQQRLFGKESRVSRNNTGSFCFLSKAKDKPVQPATALLVKKDEDSRSLHSFSYFEDTSYRNNTELLGILYPVMEYDNENEEFQSYIEMFAQEEVATNILDEKGAHYMLPQGSSLVGRLTFISTDKDEPNSKNFFFSPEAGEKLELASGGSFMLLGNSGTERIGKTTLEFERFSKVLISEGAEGKAEFEEYGGVESAVTSIAKVSQETSYFTDSQRAPLFGNTPTGFNVMEAGKREVAYKEVESGKLAAGSELIFIPTLAFKDNDGLEELDKLLIKKRLEYGTKLSGSAYVTPQGFLKNGNAYDFIKKSNGYAGLLGAEEASTSRFNITNVNADFNLSISKEDVFFVLTPEIIENSGVNFDVLFGIQGFTVDLNKDRSTSKGTQRTIIFKYSKHSVDELLKDTARWSNWGKFVRVNTHNMPDWRPVQQGLLRLFDDYERRYDPNGSPNPDYEYIHKSVRMDPNWNGVLILDIPLGEKEVPNTLGGMLLSQNSSPQTPPVNTDPKEKRQFKTGLKFQYVAFPVNKTRIDKSTGIIDIRSTSFYGLIDYDILEDRDDFDIAKKFFTEGEAGYKFLLSKLLVRFENSEIRNFQSYTFLKIHGLFEDAVSIDKFPLTNEKEWGSSQNDRIKDLIRMEGHYQKVVRPGQPAQAEFTFSAELNGKIKFDGNKLIEGIDISKASFSVSGEGEYRFDIDAAVYLNPNLGSFKNLLKFRSLQFRNVGLKLKAGEDISLPSIDFDISKLLVLPEIDFDGKSFLGSFPVKFSRFQAFRLFKGFKPDWDYFSILSNPGECDDSEIPEDDGINLWAMVFDFDMGTLGSLSLLKALKGELVIAWTKLGGFQLGFKLNGTGNKGLHLDLFGALKLDIEEVNLCSFKKPDKDDSLYILRLEDVRLTAFGKSFPKEGYDFNGIIFADPKGGSKKTAWFMAATKNGAAPESLVLGAGQRVGPKIRDYRLVSEVIDDVRAVFNSNTDPCTKGVVMDFYQPERNWLIASEDIIPDVWKDVVDLQFVFNDPDLYGLSLNVKDLLKVDVIYKKLSESLGVYSGELSVGESQRHQDFQGFAITLPNIGADIYTNGDWKGDIPCLVWRLVPLLFCTGQVCPSLHGMGRFLRCKITHYLPEPVPGIREPIPCTQGYQYYPGRFCLPYRYRGVHT